MFFKSVADCKEALIRYHRGACYKGYAANRVYLVCQPIPGSRKYPGGWSLAEATQYLNGDFL